MSQHLSAEVLGQLFLDARTQNKWQTKPVSDALLTEMVDIAKMGPTSANCSPMRVIFVKSPEAKARLKPALSAGNLEKTMAAPVTAIIGHDMMFYEHLPFLFPHADAKSWFVGKADHVAVTALRNGTLQGAYLMLAARSLGLDVGAMSGFDNAAVDAAFFPEGRVKSNFLVNIGYGNPEGLFPRSPRFSFDEIAKIV